MDLNERLTWAKGEFDYLSGRLNGADEVSPDLFYRVRNWKISNQSMSSDEEIRERTRVAFDHAKEDRVLQAVNSLTELHGLRIPMASSILAMRFPNSFAVIDKWVIKAIEREEWLETYLTDPMTYVAYLGEMRNRARQVGKNLREYERTLFELSLKDSKKKKPKK